MTDLFLMMIFLSWPVLMMQLGARLSRIARDRRIDREIDENTWRA